MEDVITLFGRVLEGSLDIQRGELFSLCTAGDIRVRFEAVAPAAVSVVGWLSKLTPMTTPMTTTTTTTTTTSLYLLDVLPMVHGFPVGLVYSGFLTADQMFDKADQEQRWWHVAPMRALCVLWTFALLYTAFGPKVAWHLYAVGAVCAAAFFIATLQQFIWGPSLFAMRTATMCVTGFVFVVCFRPVFARIQAPFAWLNPRTTTSDESAVAKELAAKSL